MNKDVLIIGGGISGIYAAIEAASKSSNILLVENEKQLGGVLRRLPLNKLGSLFDIKSFSSGL